MKNLMKKISLLVVALLVVVPVLAKAEEKDPVEVTIFRGEGCPHCEEALEWFDEIKKDNDKFVLKTYEVWKDQNNSNLMTLVGKSLGEEPTGVPYIIVGKHTIEGFSEDNKKELLSWIDEEYEKDEKDRDTVVADTIKENNWVPSEGTESTGEKEEEDNSVLVGIIACVVVVGFGVMIYFARKD